LRPPRLRLRLRLRLREEELLLLLELLRLRLRAIPRPAWRQRLCRSLLRVRRGGFISRN
jgi:hypothetical protein